MSNYWQYEFPPFFTIQPNDETRRLQMDAWCEIILDHCRRNRQFVLNIGESLTTPPFRNNSIDRALTEESLITILNDMMKRGRIEWIHNNESTEKKKKDSEPVGTSCLVYWNKPEEWAEIIHNWAVSKGYSNTVCTFYEIVDDDNSDESLSGLDQRILLKSCQLLERDGKATVMKLDNSFGVKFL
ncbi:hypothetical protein RDWZM_009110 [Blomia tropicalis]|uniref:Vacuolar protein-sorting-associated protein 25 n=1 Tax=Blomia tropicalis TaxID=40697 RepID=A0A9Q0M0S2_BLOTA|nr:Vacuolar protein-sorting-associated protein 25 [Blomia tropicalis]KAJ6217953.1 hypothetical protein RDWZM_009110 [Blomia tropicalis]